MRWVCARPFRPQETQAAYDMRLRVDDEHRVATDELANAALERYMSNNAMLAELFDGRPYRPPPGITTDCALSYCLLWSARHGWCCRVHGG